MRRASGWGQSPARKAALLHQAAVRPAVRHRHRPRIRLRPDQRSFSDLCVACDVRGLIGAVTAAGPAARASFQVVSRRVDQEAVLQVVVGLLGGRLCGGGGIHGVLAIQGLPEAIAVDHPVSTSLVSRP